MRVVIVGGKLQGVEATYLAHKAGWEVILVDKNSMVPAAGLCDAFYQLDMTSEALDLPQAIKEADLIIPALEEPVALERLSERAARESIPLAYDAAAYAISSSKRESALLFAKLGIPIPTPWPKCALPVIVKPSNSSGSRGVRRINRMKELTAFVTRDPNNWVIQEFLPGPSYSLEVVGVKDDFVSLQSTEIVVDSQYDCKRVLAPAGLSSTMNKKFKEIAVTIADALSLNGIMDIEVISHEGTLKVLEIDVRLPSQTPTVVIQSTGINMLELLYDVFVKDNIPIIPDVKYERGVVYEHIKVTPGILEVAGEHIMANARPLNFYEHFFGADEALTDFVPGHSSWVATLIITADSREEAWHKRCLVIEDIRDYFGLSVYGDPTPNCSEVASAK